jgi:hypothetical protein
MKAILNSAGESKNFNVKSTVLAHLFKVLVQKSLRNVSESQTVHYLEILF